MAGIQTLLILIHFYFLFITLNSIASFFFQITYKKDTICDTAFIPGIIDSLFVNGVYLSPETEYDKIWIPDSSDSLYFYWKDKNKSDYYYIYIHSDLINSTISDYISDSIFVVAIDPLKKDNMGNTAMYIAKWDDFDLYKYPFSAISSKELFVYYTLTGPEYISYKQLLR